MSSPLDLKRTKLQGNFPLKDGSNGKTFKTRKVGICIYLYSPAVNQALNSGGMLLKEGRARGGEK